MEKFELADKDIYYIHRRLRALGIQVSPIQKNIALELSFYSSLKPKDKKKIQNLIKIGYNIQTTLF